MKTNPYDINFAYGSTTPSNEIENEKFKILSCLFDVYEIDIVVDSQNRFIRVKSLKKKRDAVSLEELSYLKDFSAEKLIDDYLNTCED